MPRHKKVHDTVDEGEKWSRQLGRWFCEGVTCVRCECTV